MTPVILEIILFAFIALISVDRNHKMDWSFMSFDYTNTVRGLAILMIVMMHTGCFLPSFFGSSYFGAIGVSLFLIVSAYGLGESYKKNGITNFWKKKLLRIWLPYVLFLLIVTIAKQDLERLLTIDFLLDVLCLKTSYWFIAFLIYNYIIFWIGKKIGHNIVWFLLLVFGVLELIYDYRIRAEQLLSFPIGLLISEKKELICQYWSDNKFKILGLAFGLAILSALCLGSQLYFDISDATVAGKCLLWGKVYFAFAIMLIISVLPPPIYRSRFVEWCASVSLELYLVHFTFYTTVLDKEKPFLTLCIFLLLSFGGAYLLNLVNRKIIIMLS